MSGPLRLRALLAHPANGRLRFVAGPDDAAWAGVVVGADESELANDDDGSLAILTAAAPSAPWQQDALLRRVRDRGYRGLALPHAEDFGSGARAIALRLGLTLLDAARPVELAKACWQLVEARDALTLDYVRRIARSFAFAADDLPGLLRHLAANLGHGLAVVDASGILHEAGGRLGDALRAGIATGTWIDVVRSGESAAASVRIDSPTRTGLRLVLFGDGLDDAQLQALAVAAEIAMPAVAARILIDDVAAVNDAAVSSGLLRDFLDLRGVPNAEVERRMLDRGWRTGGHHLGFRILGRSRLDTFQLLRLVSRETGVLGLAPAHATTSGRGVSGWITFADPPGPKDVEAAVSALRDLHTRVRRSFNVATGVGSVHIGSAGLSSTLGEASDAARIASDRSAMGWFVRVDSLGLDQLLLAWTGSDTFLPAAESLLAPLRTDRNDLLATLSAYLDHESSIAATAAALGLHRNTVAARVHRIEELLGIDMASPEARLALHLACRAVKK
ncbi:helix-turn-helix domain-containing protein [Sinomonas sp. ASV322]|uniref:helix-turn-helix domain-containing protein n=1 Tax=Sinomonas sp. ASV322 TaxID=3041920 RepID=UPI0027DB1839|nr:helix-turn-helix domain-containing protein [Sinomonas sp. ASV322]MDQ4502307.1 helix-turn-helix domain-containing protein [Sinomonas sp. ASV322]